MENINLIPPRFKVTEVTVTLSEVLDWGLDLLGIPDIWNTTQGEGVKVCILDTGIDYKHPDLKDAIVGMKDFTGSRSGPMDMQKHGTHVAGIIGARANNSGVVGVAPKCDILIGKVLDDNGMGTLDNLVDGIEWALSENADIISMSLGAPSEYSRLNSIIQKAYNNGKILIAAAGNGGRFKENTISYPAKYTECIAVGSVDRSFKRSLFSSYGRELDIMAPGDNVYSTIPGGIYGKLSGTSMATPFVAGICALILSKHKSGAGRTPIHNNKDMLEHLIKSCKDLGDRGFDAENGYGLINPGMAFESASFDILPLNPVASLNEGCMERTYDRERARGETHDGALKNAREVCRQSIGETTLIMSYTSMRQYILGEEQELINRIYLKERERQVNHNTALFNAKSVYKESVDLIKTSILLASTNGN